MKMFLEACTVIFMLAAYVALLTAASFAVLFVLSVMGVVGLVVLIYRAALVGVAALKPENDC